jgi:hypothetical protein
MLDGHAHHAKSLELTQGFLRDTRARPNFNGILANTMVMLPYGFVFRRVNRWVGRHKLRESMELLDPATSSSTSWIALGRAIGLAIVGLFAKPGDLATWDDDAQENLNDGGETSKSKLLFCPV